MSEEGIVRILDENTANKIAAGEVVERPASIVKELIENSLDAGSTMIEIEIIAGGTEFIRITDNGQGMSQENAKLAILRHATSKITSADDLSHLTSLGFRGEALPSIAAVSNFTLLTRRPDDDIGTKIEIAGGHLRDVVEAGAAPGTTIMVRDLFFNTPARRKFLKTIATESSQIHDIVGKISLSHPQVSFKLINQQRLVLSTPGNGKLTEAAASLYGHKIIPDLLTVEFEHEGVAVKGIVAKPNLIKGTRSWQTFIVNQRVINNRMMGKALDNAYHSLLPKSGFPLVVLSLSILPEAVDVNVHPQKAEIKFSNDQLIYQAIYRAVKSVLLSPGSPMMTAASAPALTSHNTAQAQILSLPLEQGSARVAGISSEEERMDGNFTNNSSPLSQKQPYQPPVSHVSLYANEQRQNFSIAEARQSLQAQNPVLLEQAAATTTDLSSELYPLGQVDNCYIVAQGQDGLYVVDQHAAHERILYDRMSMAADRVPSQQLLVPQLLEVREVEADLMLDYQGLFYELGFSVEAAGPATIRLMEAPADISADHAEAYIRDILQLLESEERPTPQALRHSCLQLAACHGAIRAGEKLNMRQMQALIAALSKTQLPYTCPHGRPAMIRFTPHDLSRFFKRT